MSSSEYDYANTNPGMHKSFKIDRFPEREANILNRLKGFWYLTNSGQDIVLGANARLSYYLMRPVTSFAHMFNLDREIICVFSPYPNFESRTIDAFDFAEDDFQTLRLEKICRVVISLDPQVEPKINNLLKSDPEQPIVIPFTYEELESADEYTVRNRFRTHFYTRDLFSFMTPLKTDLYFFGRTELIQEIITRHRSGEHSSLFGLRKGGKTSVIYALERFLKINGDSFISIDCESPSIHQLRWNELLHKLVCLYIDAIQSKIKTPDKDLYDEKNAADQFFKDMLRVHSSKKKTSALIMFDEIERISPSTASSEHWQKDVDFIYFWQTLRAFYQRNPSIFTYMLVGTNPSCIESSVLNGHENPIFKSIPSTYMPSFTLEQVREMVRKLGRYMGIKFEENIYGLLHDDFGGHPFLIRQICSEIHKHCTGDRPISVDKPLYLKAKASFSLTTVEYLEMMTQVLRDWYPNEYEVLVLLANEDLEGFELLTHDNPQYTNHLTGYGLVQRSKHGYAFTIELAKQFLKNLHRYERENLSQEEMLEEISMRRNNIERNFRKIMRNVLRLSHGKKSSSLVLSAIPESRKAQLKTTDIEDLLSFDSSPLYFLDLINVARKNWSSFENVFEMSKDRTMFVLEQINEFGRPDAHAKSISKDEFTQLRLHFNKLENIVNKWI